jgi:hypothetical protein
MRWIEMLNDDERATAIGPNAIEKQSTSLKSASGSTDDDDGTYGG